MDELDMIEHWREVVVGRIEKIEARLDALERMAHPPVNYSAAFDGLEKRMAMLEKKRKRGADELPWWTKSDGTMFLMGMCILVVSVLACMIVLGIFHKL